MGILRRESSTIPLALVLVVIATCVTDVSGRGFRIRVRGGRAVGGISIGPLIEIIGINLAVVISVGGVAVYIWLLYKCISRCRRRVHKAALAQQMATANEYGFTEEYRK